MSEFLVEWASYQIRKIAGCACAGNAGNVFPRRRIQRKTRVSDPGMHHGSCVTHVPWCMSGLLTRGGGKNVPGIPGACAPEILRIWQEAHGNEWERGVYKMSGEIQNRRGVKSKLSIVGLLIELKSDSDGGSEECNNDNDLVEIAVSR